MNPLKNFMGQQTSPISEIMKMMNSGANPQMMVEQMLKTDPRARQFMEQMKNMSNGRSPKEMAMQYAKQQGISEQELSQLANRLGLK